MSLQDSTVMATETVRVGAFRCTPDDSRFATAGQPIEGYLVVFPRTGVWICHAGSRPFVADPGIATIYNAGQEYVRAPLSAEGDRSDWFGVSQETALAIARDFDPSVDENPARPFRLQYVRTSPQLYALQRRIFVRAQSGTLDRLELEETILGIFAYVLGESHAGPRRVSPTPRAEEAQREIACRARAELVREPAANTSVTELARVVAVSPYHLCRIFKKQTGTTLHGYRLDLRLRIALERLDRRAATCSRLAFELGFSSHSHFTSVFRRRMGWTPSQARQFLAPNAVPPPTLRPASRV